jgi:hypothetical protein
MDMSIKMHAAVVKGMRDHGDHGDEIAGKEPRRR